MTRGFYGRIKLLCSTACRVENIRKWLFSSSIFPKVTSSDVLVPIPAVLVLRRPRKIKNLSSSDVLSDGGDEDRPVLRTAVPMMDSGGPNKSENTWFEAIEGSQKTKGTP